MNTASLEDLVARWVARTCLAQGVPEKVTDAGVLRDVGVLLGARVGSPRAPGAPAPSTRAPAVPLQPPGGLHPIRV